MYFKSLSNATHPIQIHKTVLEKLRFEKKVKRILTSNISENYGPIILPKELGRELSKSYLYKEFGSDLVNFTPVIVGHTKHIFFIFQFFSQKLTNRMNSIFTDYSYLYSALS